MMITANQITLIRIILLPVPYYLIYGDNTQKFLALFLFTLLGFTDYIDGVLARKQGSTPLGALLDPIADKIFLAFTMIPIFELGILPIWMVGSILIREFVVTELRRISTSQNKELKVSFLAKIKTTMQMVGMGLIFFLYIVQDKTHLLYALTSCLIIIGCFWGYDFIKHRKVHEKLKYALVLILLSLGILSVFNIKQTIFIYGIIITFVTLASGFQYIYSVFDIIKRKNLINKLRLMLSIFIPILVISITPYTPKYLMPFVILILVIEFSAQAIDIWINKTLKKDISWIKISFIIPCLIAIFFVSYLFAEIKFAIKIFIVSTLILVSIYTVLDVWWHRKAFID